MLRYFKWMIHIGMLNFSHFPGNRCVKYSSADQLPVRVDVARFHSARSLSFYGSEGLLHFQEELHSHNHSVDGVWYM